VGAGPSRETGCGGATTHMEAKGGMTRVGVRRVSHGVVEISTTPWLTCIQHSEHSEILKSRKDI